MQTKYFLAMGIPLIIIAGCAQQPQTDSSTRTGQTALSATAKSDHDHAGHNHAEGAHAETVAKADTHSTKLAFSSTPGAIPAGKPATWTIKISDVKTGASVKEFDVVHDKLMHLIVVKNDLSWFNHIHPTLKPNGDFVVTTTLPSDGTYKLYADYTPTGKKQEVPQYEFATGGAQPSPSAVALVPDKMNGAWMTKKVVAHAEGEPDSKGGGAYEVALMPMPNSLRAVEDSMLHFQVRDAKGQPIKDLQPYLGAMGHCVILSSDTKKYLHSHPMEGGAKHDMSKMGEMKHSAPAKSGGPDVMFHTNFPTAGKYKAWVQFMHKGRIITAAFVLNVGASKAKSGNSSTHDESQPHNHAANHAGRKHQNVTVAVDGSGYSPASVKVKAGQEVRMTFVSKGGGCANSVSIPALKQTFDLQEGQKKEIVFTPKKGQTIAFACSMDMFKGKIKAQ